MKARSLVLAALTAIAACLPAASRADPLPTCSGSSIPICQDSAGRVHIFAPITVHGTLNYFGTDASDTVKLSSQGIGSGGVVLATDVTTQNYMPLNLRGEGITGQYKVEDPSNTPSTFSAMSYPGFKLEPWTGEFRVYKNLRVDSGIDLSQSAYAYFKGNAAHGYRFNDSADSVNLMILDDAGRLYLLDLAGSATRQAGDTYVVVGSDGKLRKSAIGPTQ